MADPTLPEKKRKKHKKLKTTAVFSANSNTRIPQEQMSRKRNNSSREPAAGSDSSKKMLKAVVGSVKKTLAKHVDASKKKPLASSSNDALADVSTNEKHITGVLRERQRRARGKTRRTSLSNGDEQNMVKTENDVLNKQETQHMTPITNAAKKEKKSVLQKTEVVDNEVQNMVHETEDLNEKTECAIKEGSRTTGDASKVFMETKEAEKGKETNTDSKDDSIAKRVGRRLRASRNAENNTASKTQEPTNGGSAVVTRKTINKRNQRAKKELAFIKKIDICVQRLLLIHWVVYFASRSLIKMMDGSEEQDNLEELTNLERALTVLIKIIIRMKNFNNISQTLLNAVENFSNKCVRTETV